MGILIAIPASIGYNFFLNHVRTFMVRTEVAAKELLAFIDTLKKRTQVAAGGQGKENIDLSDLLEDKLK
jgi:hypothetical protein